MLLCIITIVYIALCLIDFKCAVIIITTIIIIAVSCFFVINGTPVFPGHSLMEPLVLPQPNGTSQWCSLQPNGTLGASQANGTPSGAPPVQWNPLFTVNYIVLVLTCSLDIQDNKVLLVIITIIIVHISLQWAGTCWWMILWYKKFVN